MEDMSSPHASAIASIELLVRRRQTREAHSSIRKLLREPGAKSELKILIAACDWYRRLGLFREAFFLVRGALTEPLLEGKDWSTRNTHGRKLLWAARLLNLMGASSQALMLARKLGGHDAESHQVLGNIFLANFEPTAALAHFEQMMTIEPDPQSYRSQLNKLSFADALAGVGRSDEAIAIAREIAETRRLPDETLLTGIAFEAWGEYLARAGRLADATQCFRKARGFFPISDQTLDLAFLDKWEGYAAVKLGDLKQGLGMMQRASERLRKMTVRAEAWLDVFRLIDEVGALPKGERARLFHYPGLQAGFKKRLKSIEPAVFGTPSAARIAIDLDADEFAEDGKRFLGLNHELRLLAALRVSEDWGLSLERAKAVLWPEEVHAYPQLDARLHKLLGRLRTRYHIQVVVDEGQAYLAKNAYAQASVTVGTLDQRPSFLKMHPEFSAKDLSSYYEISRSQRAVRIQEWISNGWIKALGRGGSVRYCVIAP